MKKFFVLFAVIVASMVAMAQSHFYVIMKDGSGASFPETSVDSLTFDDNNGAKILGFEDFLNSIAQLKEQVETLIGKNEELSNSIAQLKNDLDTQTGINTNQSDSIAQLRSDVDSLKKLITSKPQDNDSQVDGHGFVDLELPSGTLWATTNIGAESTDEYGMYFVYGDTEAKEVGGYSPLEPMDFLSMYFKGYIDGSNNLTSKYDPATVYWGENWKTPTKEDINELLENCNHVWTSMGDHNGILFTGKNGKTLFLPVAGMKKEADAQVGTRGYYMLATAALDDVNCNYLYLSQESASCGVSRRSYARPVRPIMRKYSFVNKQQHDYIDLGLPSGRLWATQNLGAARPDEVGLTYNWGHTDSDTFDDISTIFNSMSIDDLVKQNITNKSGVLTPEYDAATSLWGEEWKMPTVEDFQELIDNCDIYESRLNETIGITVSGPNGNRIFIPTYGVKLKEDIFDVKYWSSSADPADLAFSFQLRFLTFNKIGEKVDKEHISTQPGNRGISQPIRPVRSK